MRKVVYKLIATLSICAQLYCGSWTAPEIIDDTLVQAIANVTMCYDSTNDRIFAAWGDTDSGRPAYSIYSNGAWSTPAFIDREIIPVVNSNVFLCYDSGNDLVFAAWRDTNNGNFPYYSVYNSGIWSVPSAIVSGVLANTVTGPDVFLCYDPTNERIFATWVGGGRSNPVFSIYNGSSWSARASIDGVGTPINNVYLCFDSTNNRMIATWPDPEADPATSTILYGTYSGAGPWSAPATIATASADNVFVSYNSTDNETIATWLDKLNSYRPTYSVFNGTTWTTPAAITTDAANSTGRTLFTCFDSANNQTFATWGDASSNPTYSIYNGSSWSSDALINTSPPGVKQDLFLAYNSMDDQVFGTFGETTGQDPYYTLYTMVSSEADLTGAQFINDFGVAKEYYNVLSWQPSPSSNASAYVIYRNGTLLARVGATTLSFEDHNRIPGTAYTYTVATVDNAGAESAGVSVTIR